MVLLRSCLRCLDARADPRVTEKSHRSYGIRTVLLAVCLPFLITGSRSAQSEITAKEFASKAIAALPVEQPYDFARALSEGSERIRRNPAARPSTQEMQLPAQGWRLIIPSTSGTVLRQAAETFRDYLDHAMGVQVALDHPTSDHGLVRNQTGRRSREPEPASRLWTCPQRPEGLPYHRDSRANRCLRIRRTRGHVRAV